LTRNQSETVRRSARELQLQAGRFPDAAEQQVVLATELSARLETLAPELASLLAAMRYESRFEAVVVHGLPVQEDVAPIIQLALTLQVGEPFNYAEQLGGALAMRLEPKPGSAANTNSTRDEFSKHSDDAAMPEDLRVTWISLYGVENPHGTLTGYAPILQALEHLPIEALNPLFSPRWQVRFPLSFGFGQEVWSEPRSLLGQDERGRVTIGWPSYATRPLHADDVEALQALAELDQALDREMSFVAVSPGTMLLFSNSHGVHMRTPIAEGQRRLILRNYIRPDLDALRAKAGHGGYIFSLRALLLREGAAP
jgi:hypothetical protein